MKRYIPAFIVCSIVACLAGGLLPHKPAPGIPDLTTFGKLPVLVGGRIQPLDTTAANSLLIIHGRQSIRLENGRQLDSLHWLADVLFNAPEADQYPAFVIDNPEVLGLFGWQQDMSRKFFSYNELSPYLARIEEQGNQAEDPKIKNNERTPYQAAISKLRNSVAIYQRLKNSIQPEPATDFASEVRESQKTSPPADSPSGRNRKASRSTQSSSILTINPRTATTFWPTKPISARCRRKRPQ